MKCLDLYSKIEPYLGFEEEIYFLHREFLRFIMIEEIDNILDIGCGQGEFLENLEINCKKSLGIDASLEQVKVCQEKGLNAENIALKDIKDKFNCATAIFDVLNYIPKNELKEFIAGVNEILNKDGYFVFDINTYFGFDEVAQGSTVLDTKDKFIAIDANFDGNKLKTDLTLFEKVNDRFYTKQADTIIQEYHAKEFLEQILKDCGFEVKNIKEFFLHTDDIADKLIFFCKKIK